MAERRRVCNIPAHRSFVDALAAGLMREHEGAALARLTVLLPNRRAIRALTEAFVRLSGGGLLLPRMLPIGDIGEAEALGSFDGVLALESELPPAADAFERRMLLMPLVARWQKRTGRSSAAVETLRLVDALAATLDQLELEDVDPARLEESGGDLGEHWNKTAVFLSIVVREWPRILATLGKMGRVRRRQALLRGIAARWGAAPPARHIVAAGMAGADPAAAALLAAIAAMPTGSVVLPGLDSATADWDALAGFPSHPQASLHQMLARMGIARGEVLPWPYLSDRDGPPERSDAIASALALPASTANWPPASMFAGLKVAETANPAEEAAVIALAMRRQLETPGASAALVTPDRGLARRVAAQLGRWDIEVDDTAGTPLARTPAGTLTGAAIGAGAHGFAPVALLALLKHPLAGPEDPAERLAWLDDVRRLDLALRGVRPAPGLKGIAARIRNLPPRAMSADDAARLKAWWKAVVPRLRPLESLMKSPARLDAGADALRAFVDDLSGGRVWRGPAGRAAADLIAALIAHGASAGKIPPADLPALFGAMANDVAVRPAFGRHPRLAIYGLLEARLQRADLMVLGGLNEGVWPAADSFDPWLPPALRRRLGLPETERAAGLAAHDFTGGAGAPAVLLTRARRDASAPTVPSRLWLRLTAFSGGRLESDDALLGAARALDVRTPVPPAAPPKPAPPAALRPKRISVTAVDRLRADPFSFYAQTMLRLDILDPLDADPSAADKGTLVHAMLERLIGDGGLFDSDARARVVDDILRRHADQPLIAALWRPRVVRMLDWAAATLAARRDAGWRLSFAERKGRLRAAGVELTGKADIIQRGAEGLAIADFKTGRLPGAGMIADGFALQLGLLGWLAEAGVIAGIDAAPVTELAYWKLSGGEREPGKAVTTAGNHVEAWGDVPAFIAACRSVFEEVANRYLTGTAPFEARLHPEHAAHLHDYDHLSRLAEWQGRK